MINEFLRNLKAEGDLQSPSSPELHKLLIKVHALARFNLPPSRLCATNAGKGNASCYPAQKAADRPIKTPAGLPMIPPPCGKVHQQPPIALARSAI